MRSRLAAIALALAALAAVGELLHSRTGAALVARLDRFYDVHHGIGEPCEDRARVVLHGGHGLDLDVPRCWTVARLGDGAVPTDKVRDPDLELEFTISYIRREDAELWAKAAESVEMRKQDPMTSVTTVRDWQILSTATQRPGHTSPNRYYEWTVSNGRVVALVVFQVHKFYVALPKVTGFLDGINDALRSARMADAQAPTGS